MTRALRLSDYPGNIVLEPRFQPVIVNLEEA
jgi:hypothetical protein